MSLDGAMPGYAMLRKGDWKSHKLTVHLLSKFLNYTDLSKDLAELKCLREEFPEKYQEMLSRWSKLVSKK